MHLDEILFNYLLVYYKYKVAIAIASIDTSNSLVLLKYHYARLKDILVGSIKSS